MDAMPGPQFEEDGSEKRSWLGRNSQRIVLSLIIILLAVGGYYFYRNYQERQSLLRPALEESQAPTSSPLSIASQNPQTSAAGNQSATPEVKRETAAYTAKAAKGNGATHLARQSLKEYVKARTDLQLKPEHKIYIEDYLQKRVSHPSVMKVGDTLTFSDELMNEAINQALKLTDSQIQNLHKYVLLVPSL